MSVLTKRYRPKPTRSRISTLKPSSRRVPSWNAAIILAEVSSAVLTLTFDRPVVLRSGPLPTGILTDVAETELSVAQTSATTIAITFTGSVAAATEVLIPNPLPNAIRSQDGGFIQSSSFPVAT